jgi:hypothetical protein
LFNKVTRKRIREHDWLYIQNFEKNPWQTYRRFRDRAINSIEDLSLLAKKLPTNKQEEIFNKETIEPFLKCLFFIDESEKEARLRQPNVDLACLLAEEGIRICSSTYRKWNKDIPESAKPTLDYLEQAIRICREVGNKSYRDHTEKETILEKHKLICGWENKFTSDFERFENYVGKEMDLLDTNLSFEEVPTNRINEYSYNLWFNYGDPNQGQKDFLGAISIAFSLDLRSGKLLDNNNGTITFYNHENKEIKRKRLRILKRGANHVLVEE